MVYINFALYLEISRCQPLKNLEGLKIYLYINWSTIILWNAQVAFTTVLVEVCTTLKMKKTQTIYLKKGGFKLILQKFASLNINDHLDFHAMLLLMDLEMESVL